MAAHTPFRVVGGVPNTFYGLQGMDRVPLFSVRVAMSICTFMGYRHVRIVNDCIVYGDGRDATVVLPHPLEFMNDGSRLYHLHEFDIVQLPPVNEVEEGEIVESDDELGTSSEDDESFPLVLPTPPSRT